MEHHKHVCKKHKKKYIEGLVGPKGKDGKRGCRGPTGPTGPSCQVDYVRALSDELTSSRIPKTIDYYNSEGDLAPFLDNNTGIFTSPVNALYLVTLNVTFQNFEEGGNILVDSGNRSIKVDRFQYLKPEPAFIGQNVSVVNPENQSGEFYRLFNTKLSASGVFPIPAGGQIHVIIYQDNPNERSITAFSELSIVKLENLSQVSLLSNNINKLSLQGI